MVILSAKNITFSYTATPLFSNVTFDIKDGEKVALIGANGCGKSTLLSVLQNTGGGSGLACDSGDVVKSADVTIGVMKQQLSGDGCVFDEAVSVFDGLAQIERELSGIHDRIEFIGNGSNVGGDIGNDGELHTLIERQSLLEEQFRDGGGLTFRARTKAALAGIGFNETEQRKSVSSLSGGERSKLQLAKLLLGNDKLLFLDEPTNHLDINALAWLEAFLLDCGKACVIVSHDRYFLDKVTARTLELENRKVVSYPAGYTKYLVLKREREEYLQKKYDSDCGEIARIEAIIAQQKRFNQAHNYVTIASKQKSIDRLKEQLVPPAPVPPALKFRFRGDAACANEVLVAKNLRAVISRDSSADGSRERVLFDNVNIEILRGERVFLLGGNGCGKSTLFKLLLGKIDKSFSYGGSVRFGERVSVGYYDQQQQFADNNKTVLAETCDFLWNTDRDCSSEGDARNLLGQFLFRGDDVYKKVGELSGGEKARLILLKLSRNSDNFLLLDEPTNHLDLNSRESLETALDEFKGTMFVISHDRYLINKLASRTGVATNAGASTKIININNGKVDVYDGDYEYFVSRADIAVTGKLAVSAQDDITATGESAVNDIIPNFNASGVISDNKSEYQARKAAESEKRRAETKKAKLEKIIAELELKQTEITQDLEKFCNDYVKVTELSLQLAQTEEKLFSAMEELFRD